MVESLRNLAWTGRPKPPLGIAPWLRKQHWFRWYVVYQLRHAAYKVRLWSWKRRTGGINDRF